MIRADFIPALSWDWPIVPGKIMQGRPEALEMAKSCKIGNILTLHQISQTWHGQASKAQSYVFGALAWKQQMVLLAQVGKERSTALQTKHQMNVVYGKQGNHNIKQLEVNKRERTRPFTAVRRNKAWPSRRSGVIGSCPQRSTRRPRRMHTCDSLTLRMHHLEQHALGHQQSAACLNKC
jgi:hypothetical protein